MVRMVLVNCTGLLGEILRDAVGGQPDITVVSELDDASELLASVAQLRPDVVLWNNADETLLARTFDYFGATPATKVLAIVGDGREPSLWELVPRKTSLGQLSPTTVVSTIRAAVGR
ncbi:MAG: hypothetical protein ACRDFA_03215 [bacterium]